MDLAARIEAVAGGSSNLVGKSEVSMSGKAAAFGGRMMTSVADQILKQFADNFAAQVAALAAQRSATPARFAPPAEMRLPPTRECAALAVTPSRRRSPAS